MDGQTRRDVLKAAGVAGAAALLAAEGQAAGAAPGAVVAHRSTSGVIIPPRGASFMQWSFDTPEPSVRFAGLELGFTVFSRENAYHLDERKLTVAATEGWRSDPRRRAALADRPGGLARGGARDTRGAPRARVPHPTLGDPNRCPGLAAADPEARRRARLG
jgi:hypothetical protein